MTAGITWEAGGSVGTKARQRPFSSLLRIDLDHKRLQTPNKAAENMALRETAFIVLWITSDYFCLFLKRLVSISGVP